MVEYALVVSLLLTGSLGTFEMMDGNVEEHYEASASDIGEPDLTLFDVTTTTSAPASSTTSTTTTAAPTTTTAAPTTTSTTTTTTTTTTAPTTTAPTTTTTAAPSGSASVEWTDRSDYYNGYPRARVRMYFDDELGNDLSGASVTVTFTLSDGTSASGTSTTNSYGRLGFQWRYLDESDFPVTVTIDNVEKDGTSYTPTNGTYTLSI